MRPLASAVAQLGDQWPDSITVISATTLKILDVNRRLLERIGFTYEEVIGKRAFELGLWTREVGEALAARLIREGRVEGLEVTFVTPSGETLMALLSGAPVVVAGEAAFLLIFRDITERRRAEQALAVAERHYRNIVETASEGIWVIDAESVTTFVNPRMAEMLGFAAGEMMGMSLFDHMDADGRADAETKLERRRQGIGEQHEFVFRTKAGGRVDVLINTKALMDEQGIYAGALGLVTDITEWKRAEEETRRARALADILEERARMARELHDGVAQSLFGIALHANAALATVDSPPPAVREALQAIRSLAASGGATTRNAIQALAPVQPPPDPIQALRLLAADCERDFGFICRLIGRPDRAPLPDNDADLLLRAARELLTNVWKHAAATNATITAEWRAGTVTLSVSDDGKGDPDALRTASLGTRSFGLPQLRRDLATRAGELTIATGPDGGVQVICSWPIEEAP